MKTIQGHYKKTWERYRRKTKKTYIKNKQMQGNEIRDKEKKKEKRCQEEIALNVKLGQRQKYGGKIDEIKEKPECQEIKARNEAKQLGNDLGKLSMRRVRNYSKIKTKNVKKEMIVSLSNILESAT